MEIEHDEQAGRFRAQLPAGEAYVQYARRDARTLDLRHTVVPAEERGEGTGSELVEHVVRYARDHDLRIVPSCRFVRSWLAEHPQHAGVVARDR